MREGLQDQKLSEKSVADNAWYRVSDVYNLHSQIRTGEFIVYMVDPSVRASPEQATNTPSIEGKTTTDGQPLHLPAHRVGFIVVRLQSLTDVNIGRGSCTDEPGTVSGGLHVVRC